MAVNTKLKNAIENHFASYAHFAREMNVHDRQVRRWVNDGQRPYRKQREKIAALLDTKPHLLWKGSRNAP